MTTEIINKNLKNIGGISIALTIFNEEADLLANTLVALLEAITYWRNEEDYNHSPATLVILCDGRDALSNSCNLFFRSMNLCVSNDSISLDESPEILLQKWKTNDLIEVIKRFSSKRLNERKGYSKENHKKTETENHVNVVLLVKPKNLGKLNSHWWFYQIICDEIKPKYCVQIDVATCPDQCSIAKIIHYFECNSELAAVCPSIKTELPQKFNLIKIWQYGCFWRTYSFEWPTEVYSGYLSVLPGQYNFLRWKAINQTKDNDGVHSPLSSYFKGLKELSPFETNLYLAEDRVLCLAICTNKHSSWKTDVLTNASATTDACNSWGELLRQRRRWNNGYLACRVQLGLQYLSGLNKSNLPSIGPSAILCHFLIFMFDWFVPAITIHFYLSAYNASAEIISSSSLLSLTMKGTSLLLFTLLLLQIIVAWRGTLGKWSVFIFETSVLTQMTFIVFIIFIFSLGSTPYKLLIIFLIASIVIQIATSSNLKNLNFIKTITIYFISRPAIALSIWVYSIFNCHDTNWGTKGLTDDEKFRVSAQRINFRFLVVFLWLTTNISMLLFLNSLTSQTMYKIFTVAILIGSRELIPAYISQLKNTEKNIIRKFND